jgi:probable F420-dependent oxidoreductase
MRIGIGVSEDLPIDRQQQVARDVEAAGLSSLWTNEAAGRDALLVCQAWGAVTSTIQVGIGVVPIWTRSPAQLAMATATLQEATGGRFLLGLGVGHPATMGPWHGAEWRRPLTAAEDTLTILRTLLAGDAVDHGEGIRTARNFRLRISPSPARGGLYLAAMGPRMLALAGRLADGVLLNWSSPDEVARARTTVTAAAADAGRREPEVATYVRVAVAADRDAARRALAREVGAYCALPAYAAHFERQGLGGMVEAAKSAYRHGGADSVAGALSEEDLSRVGWWGTPDDDPTTALAQYGEAGLDHLVARVVVTDADVAGSIAMTLTALPAQVSVRADGA